MRRGLDLCREYPHWQVHDVPSGDEYSWAEALEKLWGHGRILVNVDMDMAVHPWHIQDLESCSYSKCAFAHYINGTLEPERTPTLVHRRMVGGELVPISEGDDWASFIGPGLCKISAAVQDTVIATPRVPHVAHRDLDGALCDRLGGLWHIHWPAVAHHHVWL